LYFDNPDDLLRTLDEVLDEEYNEEVQENNEDVEENNEEIENQRKNDEEEAE